MSILHGLFYFSATLSFLGLASCATPMHRAAETVNLGMEKDQVLEILGSPRRSEQYRGFDEWTYLYYKEDKPLITEIHFRNNEVVRIAKLNQDKLLLNRLERAENIDEYERAVEGH